MEVASESCYFHLKSLALEFALSKFCPKFCQGVMTEFAKVWSSLVVKTMRNKKGMKG